MGLDSIKSPIIKYALYLSLFFTPSPNELVHPYLSALSCTYFLFRYIIQFPFLKKENKNFEYCSHIEIKKSFKESFLENMLELQGIEN